MPGGYNLALGRTYFASTRTIIGSGYDRGNLEPDSSLSPEAACGFAPYPSLFLMPELTPDRDDHDLDRSPSGRHVKAEELSSPCTPASFGPVHAIAESDAGSQPGKLGGKVSMMMVDGPAKAQPRTVRNGAAAKPTAGKRDAIHTAPSLANRSKSPIIPKSPKDWAPWKPMLEELYMNQNCILRDVMDVMETNYNLRATAKMYKGQFSRWSWFKYAVKRRPRDQLARLPGKGKIRDTSLVVNSNHDTINAMFSSLLFENKHSRTMQSGLTAVRNRLHGFVEAEPGTLKHDVVFLFDDPCYRYFKTSMDLFAAGDNNEGGQVLRLAFLLIEQKLMAPDIKSFSDLCFLVPHVLVEAGRIDILASYLSYIAHLASIKFPPNHPLTALISAFSELVAMGQPAAILQYIILLSEINADTVGALRDMLERTRQWARHQYEAVRQTLTDGSTPDGGSPGRSGAQGQHVMPRLEAQSVYWAQHLLVRSPESDALAEQWLARDFGHDFAPRTERLMEGICARAAVGQFPPEYARMIECLFCGWLHDYYEDMEDWPNTFRWGRKGIDLSQNEQYVLWSIHLEDLMRLHGDPAQAQELRRKRLELQWLEEVRQQVDHLTVAAAS